MIAEWKSDVVSEIHEWYARTHNLRIYGYARAPFLIRMRMRSVDDASYAVEVIYARPCHGQLDTVTTR